MLGTTHRLSTTQLVQDLNAIDVFVLPNCGFLVVLYLFGFGLRPIAVQLCDSSSPSSPNNTRNAVTSTAMAGIPKNTKRRKVLNIDLT